jgi:hypothetical protein
MSIPFLQRIARCRCASGAFVEINCDATKRTDGDTRDGSRDASQLIVSGLLADTQVQKI